MFRNGRKTANTVDGSAWNRYCAKWTPKAPYKPGVRTGKVMFHKIGEHRRHSCASASVLLDEDLATQVQGVVRMLGGSWERFAEVLEVAATEPAASDSASF